MRRSIDLNADLGESFGAWQMGADAQLLDLVSSCNIACGFHAGDPLTMHRTVALAVARGVAIGAHPSLPDLVGFGRREMQIEPDDLTALVLYQIAALSGFTRAAGANLHHVKAHGALYSMLARDAILAGAFCDAVEQASAGLWVYGPPAGALRQCCAARSIGYIAEGFADRAYTVDGHLRSRKLPGALLQSAQAREQALYLARGESISTDAGTALQLQIESLCVHGDGAHAVELAQCIRSDLLRAQIAVSAP